MTPDVYTAMLRAEMFQAKIDAEARGPIASEAFTTKLPSDSRVENYVLGSVAGHMKRFTGTRHYQKFSSGTYSIKNEEFYSGFVVNKIDVDDDKVGITKMQPRQMVDKARIFPQQLALRTLAAGASTKHFDGTNFFATSHAIGSVKASGVGSGEGGGNILNVTSSASADGLVHKIVVLVNNGSLGIKPVIIQEREPISELKTDAGTPQADEAKEYKYWIDARYGAGYGFWWDALLINITNTPNLTDIQSYLGKAKIRMRSFLLEKAEADDDDLNFHGDTTFDSNSVTLIHGVALEEMLRTALNSEVIVQSGAPVTNLYRGFAKQLATPYFDPA